MILCPWRRLLAPLSLLMLAVGLSGCYYYPAYPGYAYAPGYYYGPRVAVRFGDYDRPYYYHGRY